MPTGSVTPAGGKFTGGTVANATTFTSKVSLEASEPALQLDDPFASILAAQNLTIADLAADAGTGNGIGWNYNGGDGNQSVRIQVGSTGQYDHFFNANGAVSLAGALGTTPAAPGTTTLSSGTGAQLSANTDLRSVTPVTFNPTAGAAATCAVAIGYPPTPTYVALGTETEPAGIAFDGTIHLIQAFVPAGWYLKLTVVNATIGTTTYY